MRTIEATAHITDDRMLVLQLPGDVAPGAHRVVVLLDVGAAEQGAADETPLRWDDGLLVYGGEATARVEDAIDQLREDRIRQVLLGYQPLRPFWIRPSLWPLICLHTLSTWRRATGSGTGSEVLSS